MSNFNSLPTEASPQLTDRLFTARGTGAGAERRPTIAAVLALLNSTRVLGFGFENKDGVVEAGTSVRRVVSFPCTIIGWRMVANASGSIAIAIKKGTPSGGVVTPTSIVASAPPTLSSQQVVSSTVLTGWTLSLAAGDVVEAEILSSPTPSGIEEVSLSIDVRPT